jgi:hypothetical protein
MILVAMTALLVKIREYDTGSKWFRYYFVIAMVTDITMMLMAEMRINSMPVANIFSVTQFFLICSGIQMWVTRTALQRTMQFFTCLIALVIAIYVLGTAHKKEFDVLTMAVENIILMTVAAIMLLQLSGDSSQYLINNHKFWFTVAVFLYFSVNTIVFSTGNLLVDDHVYLRRYTWVINSVMSIVANMLFMKGILCLPLKKTS